MYKIAAFITFNKKIEKNILSKKTKVKVKFGDQIYLNHPVHLTLFTISIKSINSLKKIYMNLGNGFSKKKFKININKTGAFLNDPLTKGHTLYYGIKKNNLLTKLQMKHLKLINKKIYVSKNLNLKINSKIKKNYKKYGFPFSGNIWIPHITIASIKDISEKNEFIKKFLKLKVNLSSEVDNIKFYRVNKDKHFFLFKTELI